jgi:hypothetical protein
MFIYPLTLIFVSLCFQPLSFKDPGPHGSGRYSPEMFPEIVERDFRKGAQVQLFAIVVC